MKHAIVLEIVHQRAWRIDRIGLQEDCGAGNTCRLTAFERFKQTDELDQIAPQLGGKRRAAAHPSHHGHDDRAADKDRHITAVADLEGIRGKERGFDHKDRR